MIHRSLSKTYKRTQGIHRAVSLGTECFDLKAKGDALIIITSRGGFPRPERRPACHASMRFVFYESKVIGWTSLIKTR